MYLFYGPSIYDIATWTLWARGYTRILPQSWTTKWKRTGKMKWKLGYVGIHIVFRVSLSSAQQMDTLPLRALELGHPPAQPRAQDTHSAAPCQSPIAQCRIARAVQNQGSNDTVYKMEATAVVYLFHKP